MKVLKLEICIWMIFTFYCFQNSGRSITNNTDDSQEDKIADLKNSVRILEQKFQLLNKTEQKDEQPVMFYATTKEPSHVFTLEKKSTVLFERVVMNVGGHFNNFDGVFVSPNRGVYLLAWTVCTSSSNYVMTELMVENKSVSRAGVYESSGSFHCGSMTALYRMQKDDHAWIRTTSYGVKNYFYTNVYGPQSSFIGVLIQK